MKPIKSIFAATAFGLMLTACQSGIGANEYEHRSVGEISRVEEGHVISSRPVMVEGKKTWIGPVVGAIVGGAAGSEIGQGDKAEVVGGVAGAAAGGVAGAAIEKNLTKRQGYAYTVRLKKNDQLISVVQGGDLVIPNGTPVLVEYGARPRITPMQAHHHHHTH